LTESQRVDVKLYDNNGALVRQVYNGYSSAGLQKLLVNGNNLAQGIYLCEIIVNDKRIVRKLVLQR
jgi:hypothetical protein